MRRAGGAARHFEDFARFARCRHLVAHGADRGRRLLSYLRIGKLALVGVMMVLQSNAHMAAQAHNQRDT